MARGRSVYLDRPSSRRRSSYSSYSGQRGGGAKRRVGLTLLGLVVLVVAVVVVQWTRAVPTPRVTRSFAPTVTTAGRVRLPWPTAGQAAVAVSGVGTVGTAGDPTPVAIASLAKMMTAYQILTDHPLGTDGGPGPSLTVSAAAVADYKARAAGNQSVLAVQEGEKLSEYQALQALLIPSANNVADLLAGWDAGSVPAFVARMNATARQLGLKNTHYADPDGTSSSTVSTAVDQLAVAQTAMRLPVFADIVAQPAATFPLAGKVFNYDYNIGHDGFIGIKTGSNAAAGGCWAFAAQRVVAGKNATVYGVVLNQHAPNGELIQAALDLGKRLSDATPKVIRRTQLVGAGTVVGSLTPAWGKSVRLVTQQPVTVVSAPGQRFDATLKLDRPPAAGVNAGAVIGTLTVGSVSTPVVVAQPAPGPTLGWRLTRL